MNVAKTEGMLAVAIISSLTLATSTAEGQIVFQQNFEGLTLGPFVSSSESGGDGTDWTDVPPAGWTRDNTTTPTGGPAEFFGFTFLDFNSWDATAGQDRALFTLASGTVMVADGDEYDDDAGNGNVLGSDDSMNVFIETAPTSFSAAPGKLKLNWSNDFRAFDLSRATIEVSYDGGNTFAETVYDISGVDDRNASKAVSLNNPASGSLVVKFGYTDADNDWWWAVDNIVVSEQVVLPALNLIIDRADGSITLQNQTGEDVNISGYQIISEFGGLDPAGWVSIADNYDADNGGAVDSSHQWSELTQSGAHGDLSEGDLASGDGGTLSSAQVIDLGDAETWIRTPTEDLTFQYISNGNVVRGIVNYEGAGPYISGDLNTDGSINVDDWIILRSNQHVDLSGDSLAQAYRHGDLTGDGVNNQLDFAAFKTAYDAANGVGAFQSMISAVPEPSSMILLVACGLFLLPLTRSRGN